MVANDVNPLSEILARPRVQPPSLAAVAQRLAKIPYAENAKADIDLSMFYAPETEAEIVSLRRYLLHCHPEAEKYLEPAFPTATH